MNSNQSTCLGPSVTLSAEDVKQFKEKGYIGPFSLFDEAEIDMLIEKCSFYHELILPRMKGIHAVVKQMAELALHPCIVTKLVPLLGNDLLLWGSQFINQKPRHKHRWHIDVEHMAWEGVTVWIALKNVISQESFSVITGSHLLPTTPQELHARHGLDLTNDVAVLNAAKMINANCEVECVKVENGQFIIFEGRLWHGTKNLSAYMRKAIILQYTTPVHKVKTPKSNDYPHTRWYANSPACLLVHGQDSYNYNQLIQINEISTYKSLAKGMFYHLPLNIWLKISRTIKAVLGKRTVKK